MSPRVLDPLLGIVTEGRVVMAWDEKNMGSAFSPENRRGRDPVISRLEVMPGLHISTRELVDLKIAAAVGSGNFQLTVPLLHLPGRQLDLALDLTYNSRLWHKASDEDGYQTVTYDIDVGWPAPGWSIGFGKLVMVAGLTMVVDDDGTRHPSAVVDRKPYPGPSGKGLIVNAVTTDGTMLDYWYTQKPNFALEWAGVRYPNGTDVTFAVPGRTVISSTTGLVIGGELYPTRINDANGNYISITYRNNTGPELESVTDTLGRVVSFHYNSTNLLTAITGPGFDGSTRTLMRLNYKPFAIGALLSKHGFAKTLLPTSSLENEWLITAIYEPSTATGYWFGDGDSISDYGMIAKVSEQREMGFSGDAVTEQGTITPGLMTRQRVYNYPLRAAYLQDAPAYTTMTENWEAMDSAPTVTSYTVRQTGTPRRVEVTYPDGRRNVTLSYNNPGHFDDGLTYQLETHDMGVGPWAGRLLQQTSMSWEQGDYGSARLVRVEVTDELGQMAATEYGYGPVHNELAEVREYDYGGVDLLRRVHTDYVEDPRFTDAHIFNLPKVVQVYEAYETKPLSRTEYDYDWTTIEPLDTPGVVQHFVRNPSGGYFPSPNVTRITSYADAATHTEPIVETRRYDITGNLVTAWAACCDQTNYRYTKDTQFAYPTAVTHGAIDDTMPLMTTQATYDFNTGLMLSATDANGRLTQIKYDAATLRAQTVLSSTMASTTYAYDDSALRVTVTTRNSTGGIAAQLTKQINGIGRVRYVAILAAFRREIVEQPDGTFVQEDVPFAWDTVTTAYDAMGRLWRQSRPLRATAGDPNLPHWSEISYDALGRVTQVAAPDGSQTHIYYNETARPSAAAPASLRTARIIDALGRERWTGTDALGRLNQVVEPDPNGSGSVLEPGNINTFYSYNALDQLIHVVQPPRSQNRRFRFDSLGRLTHQYLPEKGFQLTDEGKCGGTHGDELSWSDVFLYDDRSNLVAHIDSRGVRTNYYYDYDPLNRLKRVTYDMSGFGDTANPILPAPSVDYEYMATGDVTRIQKVTTEGVSTEERSYDAQGRLSATAQTMRIGERPGIPLVIGYGYDSVDRLTEIRYPVEYGADPMRRLIRYDYDVAGRLTRLEVDDALYASEIQYNAASQIVSLRVGRDGPLQVTEDYEYDAESGRLQHQRAQRGGASLLDLSYEYQPTNASGSDRTAQLTGIIDNLDARQNRLYGYDMWGRLIRVGSGDRWSQVYSYDRYGNRVSVKIDDVAETRVVRDGFESVVYDTRTNRITTAGFAYDEAGNQTRVPHADGFWACQYDAAGRLVEVLDDIGSKIESYTYGAGNRRLATQDVATGKSTYYVWDGDTIIAEYTDSDPKRGDFGVMAVDREWARSYIYLGTRLLATLAASGPVEYHHPDRLGTRLFSNEENADVMMQATLPFGVTLDAESSSALDQMTTRRFTSYDRSPLTGLDYAVNRYYDARQGRFMQVDPLGIQAATLGRPQTLNLYSYVQNDAVNSTDPLGLANDQIEQWADLYGSGGGGSEGTNNFETIVHGEKLRASSTLIDEGGPGPSVVIDPDANSRETSQKEANAGIDRGLQRQLHKLHCTALRQRVLAAAESYADALAYRQSALDNLVSAKLYLAAALTEATAVLQDAIDTRPAKTLVSGAAAFLNIKASQYAVRSADTQLILANKTLRQVYEAARQLADIQQQECGKSNG
jgi:RHS repeat-associated protein